MSMSYKCPHCHEYALGELTHLADYHVKEFLKRADEIMKQIPSTAGK